MELVFKRMKQLLRLNQFRSPHRTSVEATVRALLVAWALHEGAMAEIRPLLPRGAPETPTPASSWLLTGLSLETLRQQVQGTWSQARLRGLPAPLAALSGAESTPPGTSRNGCHGAWL